MEFHHIVPHDRDVDGEVERDEDSPASPDPPIWSEVIIVLSSPFNPKQRSTFFFIILVVIASVLLFVDLFYYFTTKQELQNVGEFFPLRAQW